MGFDYEKYQEDELKKAGFNLSTINEEQRSVILQPSEAPESFMCDGEITPQQAFNSWKFRLKNVGLNMSDINKAINYHFT